MLGKALNTELSAGFFFAIFQILGESPAKMLLLECIPTSSKNAILIKVFFENLRSS